MMNQNFLVLSMFQPVSLSRTGYDNHYCPGYRIPAYHIQNLQLDIALCNDPSAFPTKNPLRLY